MDDLYNILIIKLNTLGPWGLVAGAAVFYLVHRFKGVAGAPQNPTPHPVQVNGRPIAIAPVADLSKLSPEELAQLKKLVDGAADALVAELKQHTAALTTPTPK